MNRRRASASIVANPVLVGAVTTLVVIVAVFLAYNANNGLPFVPTTQYNVQISNGANLVAGNEVRSGGFRVGVVEAMLPVRLPTGRVGAELKLKLDKSVGLLPKDTRFTIRPRSALGLKYVELAKGSSATKLEDGSTFGPDQAVVPVELDEFGNIFDEPTRAASQANLQGFGDTFAGRGYDINRLVQDLPSLFKNLEAVTSNLAEPRTRLKDLFKELGDAARIVAPVSATQARLFTTMADTFEAISRDPQALKDTIAKSPPTLEVSTRSLKVQRPFLARTARLSRDLNGAVRELRGALPPLNRALAIGTPVTKKSVKLYGPLQEAMGALERLSKAPTTLGAIKGLGATIMTLQPQLRYYGPFVTVCNTWTLFWTFTAEHFTAPDNTGGSERALLNNSARQDDSVTAMEANEFATGQNVGSNNGGRPQHVHQNTWGNEAIGDAGEANCQTGQAGYLYRGNRYAPASYGTKYERAVVDTPTRKEYPDFPYIGPHYKTFNKEGKGSGRTRDRVPAGQTFTTQPGGTGVNP